MADTTALSPQELGGKPEARLAKKKDAAPVLAGYPALLPPFIGILLASTVIAIIVSTADSFLLALSTTASNDLGRGLTGDATRRAP